jgi:hypothetical protein
MRLSKVLNVRRKIIVNRFLSLGIIITAILSIVFALVTFYGQNAGNFVMSVDAAARQRGIVISETPDFLVRTSRLMSEPISGAREVTYSWLKIEEIREAQGNYYDQDHDYVAFTFYLKNTGFETVDLSYYLRITSVYNDLDKVIRVLIIEESIKEGNQNYYKETIYMKPDSTQDAFYPDNYPETTFFLTDRQITRNLISNFRPNYERRFSIVIWMEGYDPDLTDKIMGGMIKMELVISVFTG